MDIDNSPPDWVLTNISRLTVNILQPIRSFYARPVRITSGYRCPELNEAVGGVKSSYHTKGLAADFTVPGVSLYQVYRAIIGTQLPYEEMYVSEVRGFIHIAYPRQKKLQKGHVPSRQRWIEGERR